MATMCALAMAPAAVPHDARVPQLFADQGLGLLIRGDHKRKFSNP